MSINIQPIEKLTVSLTIRGLSPYVPHAWSEKGLRMLRMTPQERKKQPKEARNPEKEAMDSAYYTDDGGFGIPAMSIKSAIVSAAHKDFGVPRAAVQKALFLPDIGSNQVLPIIAGEPTVREDIVRVGMSQTDIRYRCEFFPWSCTFAVVLDKGVLDEKDLITLTERAGFGIGIGENRPEKGGEWGRFEVDITQRIGSELSCEGKAA